VKTHEQVLAEHAAAAAKKIRQQKFYWCRLHNGFLDMPIWRVIAAKVGAHLTVVQAFAVRLDSFANEQRPRGDVTYFDPVEFGAALDIAPELAARIFATLEDGDNAWIEQDHLTSFYERNRDSDRDSKPTTDTERKRRERAFKAALKELAKQKRVGLLTETELVDKEIALHTLRDQGRRGALTWDEQRFELAQLVRLSPKAVARHDAVVTGSAAAGAGRPGASRGQQTTKSDVTTDRDMAADEKPGHDAVVTGAVDESAQAAGDVQKNLQRDNRDSHARSDQTFIRSGTTDRGAAAGGEAAGLCEQSGEAAADERSWLSGEGRTIVAEIIREPVGKVDELIDEWAREIEGDRTELAKIVHSVATRARLRPDALPRSHFTALVRQGITAHREQKRRVGPDLPLKTLLQSIHAGDSGHVTAPRDIEAETPAPIVDERKLG
jgi:hypothetical protein